MLKYNLELCTYLVTLYCYDLICSVNVFCKVQILGAALDIPQLEPVERKWHSVWHPPSPLEFNSSLQPIFNFLLHIKVSTLKLFHECETKRKLLSDALMVMVVTTTLYSNFFRSHFVFTASNKSIWFAMSFFPRVLHTAISILLSFYYSRRLAIKSVFSNCGCWTLKGQGQMQLHL